MRRAALVAGGVLAAFALAEAFLRTATSLRAVRDLETARWVFFHARRDGVSAPLAPGGGVCSPRALVPGVVRERRVGGKPHRHSTAAAPQPSIGFRLNGGGDDAPVWAVAVGDSMLEGAEVSDDETFTARLSALTGRRVVNLAVYAQGAASHLVRLEKSGFLSKKPEVLIVQLNYNDPIEDARAKSPPASPERYDDSARDHLRLWWLLRSSWFAGQMRAPVEADLARERAALDGFAALAKKMGARLLVIEDGVDARIGWGWKAPAGVLFCRPDVPNEERLRFDGHWLAEGHMRAARSAAAALAPY